MFTRRTTTEVFIRHKNLRACIFRLVEWEIRIGILQTAEKILAAARGEAPAAGEEA